MAKKDKSFLRPKARSYMQRRVDELPIRQRFLIVCEGEKTEPNYFKKIPRSTVSCPSRRTRDEHCKPGAKST